MSVQAFTFGGAAVAREARPFSRSLIAGLFFAIVLLLFALPSGLLWNLGINYNGVTGAIASKIHPASFCDARPFYPRAAQPSLVLRHPGDAAPHPLRQGS